MINLSKIGKSAKVNSLPPFQKKKQRLLAETNEEFSFARDFTFLTFSGLARYYVPNLVFRYLYLSYEMHTDAVLLLVLLRQSAV